MFNKTKRILCLFNNVPAAGVNTLRQYINKVPTSCVNALRQITKSVQKMTDCSIGSIGTL